MLSQPLHPSPDCTPEYANLLGEGEWVKGPTSRTGLQDECNPCPIWKNIVLGIIRIGAFRIRCRQWRFGRLTGSIEMGGRLKGDIQEKDFARLTTRPQTSEFEHIQEMSHLTSLNEWKCVQVVSFFCVLYPNLFAYHVTFSSSLEHVAAV